MGFAPGHFLEHPPTGAGLCSRRTGRCGGQCFDEGAWLCPGGTLWGMPWDRDLPPGGRGVSGGFMRRGGRDWCKNLCKSGLVLISGL